MSDQNRGKESAGLRAALDCPVVCAERVLGEKWTERISKIIFYISFYAFCAISYLRYQSMLLGDDKSSKKLFVKLLIACALVAIANTILFANRTRKEILIGIAMLAVSYLCYKKTGNPRYFVGIAMICSAARIKWKDFAYNTLWYMVAFLLFNILLFAMGLTPVSEHYRDGKLRWCLGAASPNNLGALLLVLSCLWICYRFGKMKWQDYIFVLLIAAINYYGPNSRAAALLTVGMLILCPFFEYLGDKVLNCKGIKILFTLAAPLAFAFVYVCSYFYDPEKAIYVKLDHLLSSRLSYTKNFLDSYPITLFGQKITLESPAVEYQTHSGLLLDSSYMRLLIQCGLLLTIIFVALMAYATWQSIEQKQYVLTLMLLIFTVYGIVEIYMIYIYFNVFLIGAGMKEEVKLDRG